MGLTRSYSHSPVVDSSRSGLHKALTLISKDAFPRERGGWSMSQTANKEHRDHGLSEVWSSLKTVDRVWLNRNHFISINDTSFNRIVASRSSWRQTFLFSFLFLWATCGDSSRWVCISVDLRSPDFHHILWVWTFLQWRANLGLNLSNVSKTANCERPHNWCTGLQRARLLSGQQQTRAARATHGREYWLIGPV